MPLPRPTPLPRPKPTKKRTPRQDTSLLGRIEKAFLALPTAYPYLKVDGAAIGCGLPAAAVTPDEARTALTNETVGFDDKDRGWRHLVEQARTAGPDWQLVAVGAALPGLKRRIRQKGIVRDEDVDAEIVTQLLARLRTVDLTKRNVCGRLINSAVQGYLRQTARTGWPTHLARLGDHDPAHQPVGTAVGHPVQVLAGLVADGRLRRDDARLIAYTRLAGLTIAQAADRLGISESAATMRRLRAERRIGAMLRDTRPGRRRPTPPDLPGAPGPQPSTDAASSGPDRAVEPAAEVTGRDTRAVRSDPARR